MSVENTKKSRVLLIGKYYGTIQFNHVKNFLLLENAPHAARNSAVRKDRTQSGHSFFLYKIGGTVLRLAWRREIYYTALAIILDLYIIIWYLVVSPSIFNSNIMPFTLLLVLKKKCFFFSLLFFLLSSAAWCIINI